MKIVFCLPGRTYSGNFLKCWSELLAWCLSNGIHVTIQQYYSCNIYYSRNLCLGGNVLNGIYQKPFNGQFDYDYMMWIDSDILFTVQQFVTLLNHQKSIMSGLYLMEDGYQFATVENWDEEVFKKTGQFEFLNKDTVQNKRRVFPVHYTGFGFMLIKKGVFENIEYPWFKPEFVQIDNIKDFAMEDVTFCREALKLGYEILIDQSVVVGHEKTKTLITPPFVPVN